VNHNTSSVGNGQKAPMMVVRKEPARQRQSRVDLKPRKCKRTIREWHGNSSKDNIGKLRERRKDSSVRKDREGRKQCDEGKAR
jgi:hypothetical protein